MDSNPTLVPRLLPDTPSRLISTILGFRAFESADDEMAMPLTNPTQARRSVEMRWILLLTFCAQAATVDDAVQRSLKKHNVPAASIAVVRNGSIEFKRAYGEKVSAETLFQAASISKPVTAMAALHMVQEKHFGLDQNVNELLKRWKLPENQFTKSSSVTVRRLLSHTGGIGVSGFPGYQPGVPLPTLMQILDGVPPSNTPPIRVDLKPGTVYRYSGGGYTILRLLLEDTTGQAFSELMHNVVLGPLQMTHSTFAQPLPSELASHAAVGHDRREGAPIPGGWNVYPELAPDGLWTTPEDLAKFAIELWRALRGESERVLNREMARQMITKQLDDYALGLEVHNEGRAFRFRHDGGNRGYRCRLLFYPELGEGVVIMTNGGGGDEVIPDVMQALRSEYGWPQ
jgi:CubicO group peptidase (beta-lactamase class C family)